MYNFNPYNFNSLFVNSIEEAKNAPIDFGGNPIFYLNKVKNEIYLKQFNMASGKTFFGKYVFEAQPVEEKPKDEINELKAQINELYKLMEEKNTIAKKERAVKDDE